MDEFEGTLEIEGQRYRVTGVLEVRERDGDIQWSGFLVPPEDSNFATNVSSDGPYRLRLDDRRSGDVIFENIDMDGSGTTVVDFHGSGPLRD